MKIVQGILRETTEPQFFKPKIQCEVFQAARRQKELGHNYRCQRNVSHLSSFGVRVMGVLFPSHLVRFGLAQYHSSLIWIDEISARGGQLNNCVMYTSLSLITFHMTGVAIEHAASVEFFLITFDSGETQ